MGKSLTSEGFEEIAGFFEALGDPWRLQIVDLLRQGERSVGEVATLLEMPQPSASRQLSRLQGQGILARRRAGNQVYYSVKDPRIAEICDLACGRLETQIKRRGKLFR